MLGFLRGLIYGGVISGAALAVASIAAGPIPQPDLTDTAPGATSAPEQTEAPASGSAGDSDLVTDGAASGLTQPERDDTGAAAASGEDTAPVPETSDAATQPDDTPAATDADLAGVSAGQDDDVTAERASDLSPVDRDTNTVTEPEAAPRPATAEAANLTTPNQTGSGTDVASVGNTTDSTPDVGQAPRLQDGGEGDNLSISTVPVQPQAPDAPETGGSFGAGANTEEETAFSDGQTPQGDTAVVTDPDNPAQPEAGAGGDAPEADQSPAALPENPEDGSTETAALLPQDGGRVTIGRPATTLSLAQPDEDETENVVPAVNPLEAYAAEFENAENRPLMSIILIDDGNGVGSDLGATALKSFPYPLTFAVDVTLPDATARMQTFRDLGLEVLAMVRLPAGAGPQDAETTLAEAFRVVPEAIGIIEDPDASVQANRSAADQMALALRDSGHGFVLQSKGLHTVQKVARKEGVPAAEVFRDFDSAGQTPTVMRRFLDQAAFRAGQEEAGVIMMGRIRPDTISALLLWGLQDRASRVALAPVSTILKSLPDAQ